MVEYPTQGSDPISRYYENFKQYISEADIPITRMSARVLFLDGLTEKNKLYLFRVGSSPPIENLVKILEEIDTPNQDNNHLEKFQLTND